MSATPYYLRGYDSFFFNFFILSGFLGMGRGEVYRVIRDDDIS